MKRHLPLALATLLLMGAALPAAAEDGPKGPHEGGPRGERGAKMFEQADANKDGELTKEEMLKAHEARMDKMFSELDSDKSGTLSKPELDKGREKMRAEMKERFKERMNNRGEKGEGAPDGPPPGERPDGQPPEDGPPPVRDGDKAD